MLHSRLDASTASIDPIELRGNCFRASPNVTRGWFKQIALVSSGFKTFGFCFMEALILADKSNRSIISASYLLRTKVA
jgi:hypothetical protein